MKKFFHFSAIALLLCMGLFTACENLIYINGYIGPPVLSIYPSSLDVTAEGDSAIAIEITPENPVEGAMVTAEETCEWFTVKALSNERATVAVAPNPADTVRYGDIKFSYDSVECICLTVCQEGRK